VSSHTVELASASSTTVMDSAMPDIRRVRCSRRTHVLDGSVVGASLSLCGSRNAVCSSYLLPEGGFAAGCAFLYIITPSPYPPDSPFLGMCMLLSRAGRVHICLCRVRLTCGPLCDVVSAEQRFNGWGRFACKLVSRLIFMHNWTSFLLHWVPTSTQSR
jgi:hypothetical protein